MQLTNPPADDASPEAWRAWRTLVQRDLEHLEATLHEAADEADLCRRYEEALAKVNSGVNTFALAGRRVRVQVCVSADFYFEVAPGDDPLRAAEELAPLLRSSAADEAARSLPGVPDSFAWGDLEVVRVEDD